MQSNSVYDLFPNFHSFNTFANALAKQETKNDTIKKDIKNKCKYVRINETRECFPERALKNSTKIKLK